MKLIMNIFLLFNIFIYLFFNLIFLKIHFIKQLKKIKTKFKL